MSDDTTRRQFLVAAGSGTAAMLAGCGGNAPSEGDTPTATPTATPAAEETPAETATATPTEAETATPTEEETATPTPTPANPEFTGGTLELASPGPVQTLDPVNAKGSGAGYNQYQESLLEFPNGDLPPKPHLATDFSISDDGRTYTFTLKQGVSFHPDPDDKLADEFTGEDVVYSWERLAGSTRTRNADDIVGETFRIQHEGNTAESVQNYKPGSLAVEAPSKYEFRFTLETPFHGALSQIAGGAFGIIPANAVRYPEDYEKHGMDSPLYEGAYGYNEFFGTASGGPKFVATGPFKVESWSKGDQIKLANFEDYHGEGPFIDGITYTVIGSQQARFKRFKNENLDMIFGIPTADFDPERLTIQRDRGTFKVGNYQLDTGQTVKYGEATSLETDYILFNCQRTPRPVRRAFAYLINQQAIAEEIYKGLPDPAYHITPPPAFMRREGENPAEIYDKHAKDGFRQHVTRGILSGGNGWPYGLDETRIGDAKRVMESAGYGSNNRYGIEFTIFSGSSAWDRIAKRLRDKAKAAYIDVTIQKADFGTIISKAINGEMDVFSLGDGMEWPESDNFLRFLHPYQDPSFMFTRWTVNITANAVDFAGDDPETVGDTVAEFLGDPVERRHVSANAGGTDAVDDNTVNVFIEDITASELRTALTSNGYSFGSIDGREQPFTKFMELADNAWNEFYTPNKAPGEQNQRLRNRAYYIIEECNWASVQELPTVHPVNQRFWYPHVKERMYGTMENNTYNTLRLEE